MGAKLLAKALTAPAMLPFRYKTERLNGCNGKHQQLLVCLEEG